MVILGSKKHNLVIKEFISHIGIILLGLVCFGYVNYGSTFAEFNIKFSFLDFPIFIGEIVLLTLVGMGLLQLRYTSFKLNGWHILILLYILFFLLKAFYGYFLWGALSFRHAALFYYPVYAIFGYVFYDAIRMGNVRFVAVMMIFYSMVMGTIDYWALSGFCLATLFICGIKEKWLKGILFICLLIITPYALFFQTARTMVVANLSAFFYFFVVLYLLLPMRKRFKALVVMGVVLIIIFGAAKFLDQNAFKSIVSIKSIGSAFAEHNKKVLISKKTYKSDNLVGVQVYNPNDRSFEDGIFAVPENFGISEEVIKQVEKSNFVLEEKNTKPVLVKKEASAISKREGLGNADISEGFESIPLEKASGVEAASGDGRLVFQVDTASNSTKRKKQKYSKKDTTAVSDDKRMATTSSVQTTEVVQKKQRRSFDGAIITAVFRLFIWRDMICEFWQHKPLLGFDFGKPLRSISLEILEWGELEWRRDGWVAAHNAYLNIIYRSGIVGLIFLFSIFTMFCVMIKESITYRLYPGVILCGVILSWFTAANFLLILELPYKAVPFWTIFGLTYAYIEKKKAKVCASRRMNTEKKGTE